MFSDGNLATFTHENGHLLRRVLPENDMRTVERVYGIKDGTWTEALEERFANDLLRYFQSGKAPKGMDGTFAQVRGAISKVWEEIKDTLQGRKVHPELRAVFDDWFDPALRDIKTGEPTLPVETGTRPQISTRKPKGPLHTGNELYQAGRKGAKALAPMEKLAARSRQTAKHAAKDEKAVADIEYVLANGGLPAELEQNALRAEGASLRAKVAETMGDPSLKRIPPHWQPMAHAAKALGKAAEKDPGMADFLSEVPQVLADVQRIAAENGFNPTHVRQFTHKQVQQMVFGNLRLGLEDAGARKSRKGILLNKGMAEHSIESFAAAMIEATAGRRVHGVLDWIQNGVARKVPEGGVLPDDWEEFGPTRQFLLTGKDVDGNTIAGVGGGATIIPKKVGKVLRSMNQDYAHPIFGAISKITEPWRALVLTLSPGWYTRNVVGNIMMATAEGVSLSDWKAAWRSYKTKDAFGRGFNDMPHVTGSTLAKEAVTMADDSLVPRARGVGGLRDAMGEKGKIKGAAQWTSRKMLRVNEVVDEFSRSAVTHRSKRVGMSDTEALNRSKAALVDYDALSPFERSAVRSVIPFYSWQKGILKVVLDQVIDHPARTSILAMLGRMHEDYVADQLGLDPEDVPGGYKHLISGRNFRSYNPFADPGDILSVEGIIRSMNPFIELGLRKGMGAPEFYTDDYRLGQFGTVEEDLNVNASLGDMVLRSPSGRIAEDPDLQSAFGFKRLDEDALRSRLLRARKAVRGIDNPEAETTTTTTTLGRPMGA
jgi:hypothetical protein